MSESYEDLAGASGRARFFRPQRHPATALFAGAPPRIWFDDREFSLENISASGAAAKTRLYDPDDEAVGDSLQGVLRLTQRGREIFRARARQARSGVERGSLVVGFALEHETFDLDKLVRLNAHALALAPVRHAPEYEPPIDYKSFCADVLSFVGDYLDRIDRHFSPIEDKLSADEKHAMIGELTAACGPEWRRLLERGNKLVIPAHRDKAVREGLKLFTERVVTRELVGGESWSRSYYKPMGYPGDFRIMNYMYDARPEGDDLKTQFLHMLGVFAGQPIVSRMTRLAELVVGHANTMKNKDQPVSIMSIGCGPARELETILARSGKNTRWRATLVDQEPQALNYALSAAMVLPDSDRLETLALNISFKDMLNPSGLGAYLSEQDIIYSSGLVDYLNPLLAMRFVRRMYDYLKPGGKLIIGNVNDLPTGTLWPMEYVLDWTLYFRNEEEMRAIAAETPDAIISIEEDALNAIYFLVVEKPRC